MCGIAGIIGSLANEPNMTQMLNSQKHRGPDHMGISAFENCILGHNRLSIIDLSSNANQPFIDNKNRYTIVFNGEIYNYLEIKNELSSSYNFVTKSDTEVLLAAYVYWGKNCLHKLNGMFSFAIWDNQKEELFAARDRFGVKPFYYTIEDNNFVFASEIKTIHAFGVKKQMNETTWASYLSYGSYGAPDETFWENISQLPGGHYFKYSKNKLAIKKWYVFEDEVKKYSNKLSFNEVKRKYTELLKDSIKLRFRADVPVGFNVSGGLDSSALLTFVNQQSDGTNVNAFTFYTGDKNYDELPWVEEMISITQNPLHKVLLTTDGLDNDIQTMANIQDEPYGGIPTIAYSKIFEEAREKGVLVLLDGQGMDEQWAGYDYYTRNNDATIQGVSKSPFRKQVLSKKILELAVKPSYPEPFNDALLDKQYRDLFYTKIPRALRFNDRISMAKSTELREPFLDYRLVEYAFAQPLEFKIKDGIQKKLLREIVSSDLSDSISYAPKRPLQTPQREWLGNELKDFVENSLDVINNSTVSKWFNMGALREEWNAYVNGDNESSFHIWQWVNLSVLINSENNI